MSEVAAFVRDGGGAVPIFDDAMYGRRLLLYVGGGTAGEEKGERENTFHEWHCMQTIPIEAVNDIRAGIARAHALAAERFREQFASSPLPPEERWRSHLEIQAAALLESARHVSLRDGWIRYDIEGTTVTPYVARGEPLFRFFDIERTPEALLEYWWVISEILASSSWSTTRLIATSGEYNDALRRMQQPQIVRALVASFLPAAEWRDDGSAMLEVTVYARAGEERVERRLLALDPLNELSFHSRELIAEGRGGVGSG